MSKIPKKEALSYFKPGIAVIDAETGEVTVTGERSPTQKDWSDFHYWLWYRREPTPYFNDAEYEKAFYDKLEAEYRTKGLYP